MAELSESEFQKAVIQLAKLHGWRVMHTQPAQIRPGKWITPNTGSQGFPDLVMSHPYRGTIFVELKTDKGVVSNSQCDWINALEDSGEEVHVWRPCHLEKISERLARRPVMECCEESSPVLIDGVLCCPLCEKPSNDE